MAPAPQLGMEGYFLCVCPMDSPESPVIAGVLGQCLVPTSPQRSIHWRQLPSGLAFQGYAFAGASASGVKVRPGRDEGRPLLVMFCGGWSSSLPWLLLEWRFEGGGPANCSNKSSMNSDDP